MDVSQQLEEPSGDDPIIYFTLIDFLIQIIFCAIFALVVFQTLQARKDGIEAERRREEARIPGWVRNPVYLPLLRDLTPFITIENEAKLRQLLQVLKEQGALDQFLKFLKESKDPFTLIQQCLDHPDACQRFGSMTSSEIGRFLGGIGLPPCRRDRNRILQVDAFDDRLVVLAISDVGRSVLAEAGVTVAVGDEIAKDDIRRRFGTFARADCRHDISYVKRGDSEDMRHTVEQVLRPSISRRPR